MCREMERSSENVSCGFLDGDCGSPGGSVGLLAVRLRGGTGRHRTHRVGELTDVFGRACIGAAQSTRTAESDPTDGGEPDHGRKILLEQLRGLPRHAGKTLQRLWR